MGQCACVCVLSLSLSLSLSMSMSQGRPPAVATHRVVSPSSAAATTDDDAEGRLFAVVSVGSTQFKVTPVRVRVVTVLCSSVRPPFDTCVSLCCVCVCVCVCVCGCVCVCVLCLCLCLCLCRGMCWQWRKLRARKSALQ